MQKKNRLSVATILTVFGEETHTEDHCSVVVSIEGTKHPIPVPTAVMHRLYRIGQAYGIRHFRYLEPNSKIVVGSTEIESFITDIQKVLRLINDEVLHHYLDQILKTLALPEKASRKHVAITTLGYFNRDR